MGSRPVWRVRDRASFAALRHHGRRGGHGPVSVIFVPAVSDPRSSGDTTGPGPGAPVAARVGFAVGRSAGGAVARNRLRRRLRAVVADLARADDGLLPAGTYLVSARSEAAALTPTELRDTVTAAVRAATAPAMADGRSSRVAR